MIPRWIVLFLLIAGLLSANGQPDSTAVDSLVPARDSFRLWNTPVYPPMLKLDFFRYQNILNDDSSQPLFNLNPQLSGTLFTRPSHFTLNLLSPASQSGNPYLQPKIGFQNSTAFNFEYSEKIRREDDLKPEYGNSAAVFPILSTAVLAYYGAKEAYLALRPSPPLQIDSADVAILELIWNQPEITAVDVYEQISQATNFKRLTYMPVHQRLDKLKRLGILDTRSVENGAAVYYAKISKTELRKKIEQRLREASMASSNKSRQALQTMLGLLND